MATTTLPAGTSIINTSTSRPIKQSVSAAENSNGINMNHQRLALFDHLPRGKNSLATFDNLEMKERILHPATVKLGSLFSKGVILSDDDRVSALFSLFCELIHDYKTPPKKILREDLDRFVSKQIQFLVDCRPLSKGMGNLVKFVRHILSKISPESSEADAKTDLMLKMRSFLEDKLLFAAENIARHVESTIRDDDVLLTFGSSPLVRKLLLYCSMRKRFRLVVIDTRPLHEGLETLSAVSDHVNCVYSPLSGASSCMKDVNMVLLGASCLVQFCRT